MFVALGEAVVKSGTYLSANLEVVEASGDFKNPDVDEAVIHYQAWGTEAPPQI